MYIIMSIYNLFNKQVGQKIFYLNIPLMQGIPLIVYKTIKLPLAKYNNKYVLVNEEELTIMEEKLSFVAYKIGKILSEKLFHYAFSQSVPSAVSMIDMPSAISSSRMASERSKFFYFFASLRSTISVSICVLSASSTPI